MQRPNGSVLTLAARDVLDLADLSEDEHGLIGISRVKKARESIGLAIQAQKAAARIFKNGVMAGGALSYPNKLNPQQIKHIQDSLESRYSGTDHAHKWMVLESVIKAEKWAIQRATRSSKRGVIIRSRMLLAPLACRGRC